MAAEVEVDVEDDEELLGLLEEDELLEELDDFSSLR